MHRSFRRLVIAASLCAPGICGAQSVAEVFWHDFRYGVRDILAVWASPFTGSRRDYLSTGLLLGAVGLSAFADEEVADWARAHNDNALFKASEPFRANNRASLVNVGSSHWIMRGTLGLYLVGLITGREGLRDAGMGCAAAQQAEAVPRSLGFYRLVSRERPAFVEVIGGDTIARKGHPYRIRFPGEKTWYDNSFYGGHVANLATCIAFWTYRFHLSYAEPVLWLAVAGMSVARIADEAHWLSDEAFGVIIGTAIGKYVADRSNARRSRTNSAGASPPADSLSRGFPGELLLARHGPNALVGWRLRF